MVAKDPHAALWEQAERSLRYRIDRMHDTGWTVDRARDHLNWRGPSADRFRAEADDLHDALHQHNDALRTLLRYVQLAAEASAADARRKVVAQ
ncbi:hypothetical protein [Jatrophihabitans fulvus]